MIILKNYLPFFLMICGLNVVAQIPIAYKSDWHKAGLDNNFTPPTVIIDITTVGAIPNDGLDDYPAVQAIFSTVPPNGFIIYFPSGTYNFSSPINIPSNIILKGSGADSTYFVFDLGGNVANCFNFIGVAISNFYPVIGGISKGSSSIVIASANSLFSVGNRIELREQNGSWDTNPTTWATYSVGHVSTIDSIHSDTIFISEGLRIDFDALLNPEVRVISCIENSGLECFRFTRVDSLAPSINYGIYFYYAYNCRIRGVESYKSIGAHCWSEISSHLAISQCYFHEAYTYDGSNTRGYGVIMATHTTSSIIENNIFKKLRHSMMVKQGANGNVFGYNYSTEPTRTEVPSNAGADICMHGHYPFANLFEGNICQNASIDQAYGPNGPNNAFFRNRIELYGLIISSGTIQSDQQLLVGNDIPNTGFLLGNYLINGANHYQQSNRVRNVITPSGTSTLNDSSLYLTSSPGFWKTPLNWPSIGIPTIQSLNQNPAAKRFLQGTGFTICGNDTSNSTTSLSNLNKTQNLEIVNLTFTNKTLNLEWKSRQPGNYQLIIFDINGKKVFENTIHFEGKDTQQLSIKLYLANGEYLLSIQKNNERITKKFIAF